MSLLKKGLLEATKATAKQPELKSDTLSSQHIEPLPQHGAYAFLPFISLSTTTSDPAHGPIKVKDTSSWTYSGPILRPSATHLPPSLHTWSQLTISDPSSFLQRLIPLFSFLQSFLAEADVECYWLTIRASKPTPEYDERRWHIDDDFFLPNFDGRAIRYKLCTTLLGASTLFVQDNETALHTIKTTKAHERPKHQHECTTLRCFGCSTYADTVRHSLAQQLQHHETISAAPNEIAFFRIGQHHGAVHSEPAHDTDRIFVNIVPGTERELRGLGAKWGMAWPRAWMLGVTVPGEAYCQVVGKP
ncbi:hypothetical protein EK21DRAFT_104880 [Setomelanomma holmii]|uniref:Uncharacterized protein n=1 Tax=Setomelanomma holmii TaxID=210430 RepID=A0A9P4GW98_9PLEO|nr:hypothetical protein EK21DRAFT_104880 [Setomelanomma holmii]